MIIISLLRYVKGNVNGNAIVYAMTNLLTLFESYFSAYT